MVWRGGGPHLQPFSFSDLSGPLAPPHLLRPGPALILQQDHPSSSSFAFPSPAKWASYLDQDQFSSVQLVSHVQLFSSPWTAAGQASLSIIDFQSLLKPMSIESVMPSNHLTLCRPLLLQPSIFPSIGVFSKESALRIRKQDRCRQRDASPGK